jgi:hypothetical protein
MHVGSSFIRMGPCTIYKVYIQYYGGGIVGFQVEVVSLSIYSCHQIMTVRYYHI